MLSPAVLWLVIANVLMYFASPVLGGEMLVLLALWPIGTIFEPWQIVSYAFLHANFNHLLLNMLGLLVFGPDVERAWGSRRLLECYVLSVVTAALTQLVFAAVNGTVAPTVGASGGVFGLLLAFAMTFPNRRLMLLIPPVPVSARTLAIGYGVLELALGVTGTQAGVAHFAHLGGMLGAWLYIRFANRA
jgi:membrane associated rhomboid family serine protease